MHFSSLTRFFSIVLAFLAYLPSSQWYADVAGDSQVPIMDTYWQTETGGHILTPLPGAIAMKPGSATLPFFGVEPVVLSPDKGVVITGNDVEGVLALARPFPGMARSIYGDHERYLQTYMTAYPGHYFTGDGVRRDKDGYYCTWSLPSLAQSPHACG